MVNNARPEPADPATAKLGATVTCPLMVYCEPVIGKLAVSVVALFIVTVRGFDPLFTLPVNPLN
jgi:hypothetical protein